MSTLPGVDSQLRVSDAERTAVADRLAEHYADGRLDNAEFHERLEAAMAAKTRADFGPLFAGLPEQHRPGPPAAALSHAAATPVVRQAPPRHRFALLVLLVVAAGVAWHALVLPQVPWVLFVIALVLWARHHHQRRL